MSTFIHHITLGRQLLLEGDFPAALAEADAALALDAEGFPAMVLRSRAYFLLGQYADALDALRPACPLHHQAFHAAAEMEDDEPAHLRDTNGANPEGLDALELLGTLREHVPLDRELLALQGELAEEHGRFAIAREAFAELVAKAPEDIEAWEGLVHVTCHDNLDDGLTVVQQAIKRHPEHPLFYEFLGFIHFRRHHYVLALRAYRRAIDLGGDNLDNRQSMVQCFLALDKTSAALDVADDVVRLTPDDPDAHRFALDVALQCGQPDIALHHAHQLVRLEPSHADTYLDKARVELAREDWAAVERTLTYGARKANEGEWALFDLVDLTISEGQFETATRVANLAVAISPEHPESHAACGKVLRELGEFAAALDAFRRAATLSPHDDAYQTWIGVVLDNMGEYTPALHTFNKVLTRHPGDVWTLSNRGLTYLALSMPDRALADLTHALELDPEEASFYFWRGCALAQMHDPDAALSDLRRAIDLDEELIDWLDQEALLDPLRDLPRFRELRRTGEE